MPLKLLIVEDDRDIRRFLQPVLSAEGYQVLTASSISEAKAMLTHALPDIVLLDLGLPDGDAIDWIPQIRTHSNVPILVISARGQETDKTRALDAGADDYLTKPFGTAELLSRIRVALRHRGTAIDPATMLYEVGHLKVDIRTHEVWRQGERVHLTPTEFKLLARLVRSAGRVLTHRQLLEDVWGPQDAERVQYLRLYMGQLRAKLEDLPAEPRYLLTETGVGYRLSSQ
jgi:two-component system, OmpR family, KDP operon response regulator KdpE